MKNITAKYNQALLKVNEIDKQIKILKKEKDKLKILQKDIWKCPNKKCNAIFEKIDGLDSPYNSYYLPATILADKNIKLEPGEDQIFSDWTSSGFDYYKARTYKLYIICPKCNRKTFIRDVRVDRGTFIDSKDSF